MPIFTLQNWLVIACVLLTNCAVACWWIGWPLPVLKAKTWLTARPLRARTFMILAVGGLWAGIFLGYGFPITGDVTLHYRTQGRAAMSGAIPNADFQSSYMPLFPYIMGSVDAVCSNDLAIPFFLTSCFLCAGLLLPAIFATAGIAREEAWGLAIVGVLNAASWVFAVGYQQDESLMFLFVIAAALLILMGREGIAVQILSLGLFATKILMILPLSFLVSQCSSLRRVVKAACWTLTPLLALFAILEFKPLTMIKGEALELVGPSLPVLMALRPAAYEALHQYAWIGHLIVGGWCFYVILHFRNSASRPNGIGICLGLMAVWIGFVLLSPKSLPIYRLMILPLLPMLVERSGAKRNWLVGLFCIYSAVLAVHWMFYEDWIGRPYPLFFVEHHADRASMAALSIELLIDAIIVGAELVWMALCLRYRASATAGLARR